MRVGATGVVLLLAGCITDAQPLDSAENAGGIGGAHAGGGAPTGGTAPASSISADSGGSGGLSGTSAQSGSGTTGHAGYAATTPVFQSGGAGGGAGGRTEATPAGGGGMSSQLLGSGGNAMGGVAAATGGVAAATGGTATGGVAGTTEFTVTGGVVGATGGTATGGVVGTTGVGGGTSAVTTSANARWNLLVYLCPDRANRQRDWTELEASLSLATGIDVLTLAEETGGPTRLRLATTPDSPVAGDAAGATSSELDLSILGQDGTNLDLGDPAVLGAFLGYAGQTLPNRRTALIISGVASRKDGLWSLCTDDTTLTLSELQSTLDGKALDLLALDGGKTFDLAMTYQLRNTARYLVSSQLLDFSDFIGAWTTASENTAFTLAQAMVQTHDTGILGVVSALDTKQMDGLRGALDTLTTALYTHDAATIQEARTSACLGNYAGTQAVDMHAMASRLTPAVPSVTSAIENAVVAHKALNSAGQNESSAFGVAIYLPITTSSELAGYTGQNYDLLAPPSQYREFIDWFLAGL